MFKITAYYQTGNSFGSEDTSDELGVVLNTLEEAVDCLSRAKEHYKFVKELEATNRYGGRSPKPRDKLIAENKTKRWYCTDYPEGCFMFKDKNVSAYYLGYFEILHSLKIEFINQEEDSMTFIP